MFYIKEHGFYYTKTHGPFATYEEAMANKPVDRPNGREEGQVKYVIESAATGAPYQFLKE